MHQLSLIEWLRKVDDGDLLFLGEPVTVLSKASSGSTLLHIAALLNDYEIIDKLIEAGIDINAIGESHCTALHEAIAAGHVESVIALLAHNPDLTIKEEGGLDAEELAEVIGNDNIHNLIRTKKLRP